MHLCQPRTLSKWIRPNFVGHFHEDGSVSSTLSSMRGESPISREEEIFQSKMRVLVKNSTIFHEFKERLAAAEGQLHSKEGVRILLHDFLDNHLKIPDLRLDVERPPQHELPSRSRGLGLLAYFAGDSSPFTPEPSNDIHERRKWV